MEALSQPQRHAAPDIRLIPYGEDPLRALAELLLASNPSRSPDLSHAIVLFPRYAAVPRFRRVLLDVAAARGMEALLPPYAGTLTAWVCKFADSDQRRLRETAREVFLLDALQDYPDLVRRCGTWPLVDSLLTLFDNMTLNQTPVPEDLKAFTRMLADGYGTPHPPPAPLNEEARLAHTLWTAWRQQLAADALQDTAGATLIGLCRSLEQLPAQRHIYLVGPVLLHRAEVQWIKASLAKGQVTLLLHGQSGAQGYHPDRVVTEIVNSVGVQPTPAPLRSAYSRFLDSVFALEHGDLLNRTRHQAAAQPTSPACDWLVVHEAVNFEQEARAIDLQVRRWRLQGLRHIGIVTNDRKLARRVRALLERANIVLKDTAGWTLSTTSAATALVRWLECLEQDFAYAPLFSLLKSPFVSLGLKRTEFDKTVAWFEEGVALRHNIARGPSRYRRALLRDQKKLDEHYKAGVTSAVTELLDWLELAARPLAGMVTDRRRPAADYLAALAQSLETLGLIKQYREDAAGAQLLTELGEMRAALAGRTLQLTWGAFRDWLRHNLECRYFHPPMRGGDVELMGFAESRLYRFDALIVAGALREYLPGQIDSSPFFNENVRRQLGLQAASLRRYALFNDFRRLLEAAPRVVITLRREQQGEPAIPSAWVERLRVFQRIAYGESLEDPSLAQLASSPFTQVVAPDSGCHPEPHGYPCATLPKALISDKVSAAAHQRMLDCPYQYYATDGLSLTPIDRLREQLEKLDYGERVHRILQAFHIGVPGLPGPFRKPLNPQTRPEAEVLLRAIGQAVFADDIKASIFAHGWLFRWQSSIRAYLDWQMQREHAWQPTAAELYQYRAISNADTTLTLTARIDRLDRRDDEYAIIDYKTGRVPELAAVMAGEHIQLPFYLLVLAQPVAQALFLGLRGPKISDKVKLERQILQPLAEQVRQRLLGIQQSLHQGTGLPAWGDDGTCAYCHMQGLCRKEMWVDEGADSA